MDRAYEDDKTRVLAEEHGFNVVVPPKRNRKGIKRFRKVCTRYDKLDSIFLSVIMLAMIFDALFM